MSAALRDGACGFVLKRSSPALLAEAVRAAVAGDMLISPQLTTRLLRRFTPPAVSPPPAEPLAPREIEVAQLVAEGRTNGQIAEALFLAPGTVKNHIAAIQRKLGATNRVGIASWTLQHRSPF